MFQRPWFRKRANVLRLTRRVSVISFLKRRKRIWNLYFRRASERDCPFSRASFCICASVARVGSSCRSTANLRAQIAAFRMCRDSEIGEFRLSVRRTIKSWKSGRDFSSSSSFLHILRRAAKFFFSPSYDRPPGPRAFAFLSREISRKERV